MKQQNDSPHPPGRDGQAIRVIFEQSLLSCDPDVRAEQYQSAMSFVEGFEGGYGQCFIDYGEEVITVSSRDDEGEIGEVIERISGKDREEIQRHLAVIDEYETRYYEECFGRPHSLTPIDTQAEWQAVEDIARLRDQEGRKESRLAAFEETAAAVNQAQPVQAAITVIHPDGTTTLSATNRNELAEGILAAYSDGHGDFGPYSNEREQPEHGDELER